ncbi:MAG: nucleotide exchange factor GrpE [Actinomycetota bacterium]|nr:nucleotide exchange factor GrpE [Actinomycetota bacterium]
MAPESPDSRPPSGEAPAASSDPVDVDDARPDFGGAVAADLEDATPGQRREAAEALEGDLDELQVKARERDEYLALAQRAQADFENYRKRTSKDVAAAEARGVSRLARELLPAVDNLALALAAAESGTETEHDRGLLEGIRLVQSELVVALARLGIEAYSPEGERFDPEQHEAMAQHAVAGAESGTIVEVYQPGYRHNGGLLRAAKVVVAQ